MTTTRRTNVGKHAWPNTAARIHPRDQRDWPTRRNKSAAAATLIGSTKAKASRPKRATAATHTRNKVMGSLTTTMVSHQLPPLPLLPPPLGSVAVPRTTLAETQADASWVPPAPVTDSLTAVRLFARVRRRHVRGKTINFTRYSCSGVAQRSAPAFLDRCLVCWPLTQDIVPHPVDVATQSHLPERRGHGRLRSPRKPATPTPRPLLPSALTREPMRRVHLSPATRRVALARRSF